MDLPGPDELPFLWTISILFSEIITWYYQTHILLLGMYLLLLLVFFDAVWICCCGSWLKLKFIIWCLVNTNHIFFYVNPRPKLRLVGLQFLKSNYPLLFMCFLLSLSSLTLFPYFPNGSKTFLFLTQIVHSKVNWQINLAIDLQTLIFHLPQTVPLSRHYVTWSNVFLGYGNRGGKFYKTYLFIHTKHKLRL